MRERIALTAPVLALLVAASPCVASAATLDEQLRTGKYAYIASTRKDGTLGRPAEIWFLYQGGAVYVGTPRKSWRVRRIEAGRPRVKIWVGKPDGRALIAPSPRELDGLPAFMAMGTVVKEPETEKLMLRVFADKYREREDSPEPGWASFQEHFVEGFRDGRRVLVKYTPLGDVTPAK